MKHWIVDLIDRGEGSHLRQTEVSAADWKWAIVKALGDTSFKPDTKDWTPRSLRIDVWELEDPKEAARKLRRSNAR